MKRNVLMKKNKVLAFALAAAMAFTSVPMNSVHAEEGAEETGGAAGVEAQSGEASSDTETWTKILDMKFDDSDADVQAKFVEAVGTQNSGTKSIGGINSKMLYFDTKDQTLTYKLGEGYDSGKVKIVVETYSTSSSEASPNNKNGQLAFRVLDTGEGADQHALINIGHFGGVNLYTTDVTGQKSTDKNDNDSSKYKDLQYLALTSKDDTVTGSTDTNRGRWIRLETVIDLDKSENVLDFKTTVYRKNTADNDWVKHKSVSGATYNLEDGEWGNGNASMVKPVAQKRGCANDAAVFEVGAIVFECKAANAYVDNISIEVTGEPKPSLSDVQITAEPKKMTYANGEALDLAGIELTEIYSNNGTKVLNDVDEIKAAYNITGFNPTKAGEQTVTVASKKNSEINDSFEVTVAEPTEDDAKLPKTILSYTGDVTSVDELGFTNSQLLSTVTNQLGNTTQMLQSKTGTVKKELTSALNSDVVKITMEFNPNGKNLYYRILDENGKALINIGQLSRTNLYTTNETGVNGAPFLQLISNDEDTPKGPLPKSAKNFWIKLETEIDLTASNIDHVLRFKTVASYKKNYSDEWTHGYTATEEDYINTDNWSKELDTDHSNGCATAGLTEFSFKTIELVASGDGVLMDNIEISLDYAEVLDSVEVTTQPTKTVYPIGTKADIDLTGLVLTEHYKKGDEKTADRVLDNLEEIQAAYEITGFDPDTAGTGTIKVTNKKNKDVEDTFDITINDAKITGITIEGPVKKEYYVGDEELDRKGLVVTAAYSDGSELPLAEADYIVAPLKAEKEGKEEVTITSVAKKADGEPATATIEVTIKEPVITGIKLTQAPSKLTYKKGETEIDLAGIVVMATYDSGDEQAIDVKKLVAAGLNTSEEATDQIITVTYGDKTVTYTITVIDPDKFKPVEKAFDFNAGGSKTAENWIGIDVNPKNGTTYSIADYGYTKEKGYGIVTNVTALQGRSGENVLSNGDYVSITEDVYRDYVLLANANSTNLGTSDDDKKKYVGYFDVDIENGTYNVLIVVGSTSSNTTTMQIEGKYTGTATISDSEDVKNFKVIEIPGVVVSDGQMNFKTTADGNARTNAIVISNISAPSGLTGEFKAADLSVTLSWNDSLGCVKYNVYRRAEDGTIKMIGTTEETTFTDTTADLLQTYTYYVRGVSEKGLETFASSQVEIFIGDDSVQKPAAPAAVTVSDIAPDSVTLTWDSVADASLYEIYTAADNKLVGKTTETTYQVKDANHLDKSYKVLAANAGGRSEKTAVTPGTVPAVPGNLKVQALTAEATTLKWDEAADAKYYEVYSILKSSAEGKTGLEGYTLVGKTTGTFLSCTLADHMSRYYKVVAVGLGGRGDATDVATSDVPAPVKPVNVKAVPEAEKTTITWDAAENASYYEIYWSDRDRTPLKGTKYETNGIEDYELLGVSNETEYVLNLPTHIERYFRVVAVGLGGKSEPSDPAKADIVKKFNTQAEYLDRGLVAIKVDGGVYLGWRLSGDEYAEGASYNLYRDGEGIRTFTAEQNTSYLDTEGTAESKYAVSVVINGVESEKCAEVAVQETKYMDVKLNQPEPYYDEKLTKEHIKSTYKGDKTTHDIADARVNLSTGEYVYTPNDTYIGDVDGDGQYELIVKWDGMSRDNSQGGYTSPVIIDCYKLDGTQLWRINLGINVRAGAHYTQPVVGDLDGDGKAEVMMRTSDGSVDGKGNVIGAAGKDYRNTGSSSSKGQVINGPEYLTLFDGETGEALDTIPYVPERGKVNDDWKAASKGDSYGGRSERFLSGAAYLDGEHLSAIFARGYYGRGVVVAFTVENKKIKQLWKCDSKDKENASLFGQGAHSFTVADVDGDGCQEIIYGSATIDHDGKLMYSLSDHPVTLEPSYKDSDGNLKPFIQGGHGDAERVTDMNLKNPGLEAFMVHEEHPNEANAEMHDAATGEYLFSIPGDDDIGRGASGDIDPNHEGGEFWFNGSNGAAYAADGTKLPKRPSAVNHMIWFDGTMGRDLMDGSYDKDTGLSSGYIARWDYEKNAQVNIIKDEGVEVNNTTKSNPCFQADIFGDWREEVGWRTDDNQAIRIYTSWEVQDYRLYTLMHDPTYRAQMACNGSAYNQSPDAGFYIGYDTALMQVPVPTLNIVKAGETPEEPELSLSEEVHAAEETFDADAIDSKPELKAAIEKAIEAAGGEAAADSQQTVKAITDLMKQTGEKFVSAKEWSTKGSIVSHQVRDIKVERVITENGVERREPIVESKDFPDEGIDIILPLPDGVDTAKLSKYRFAVSHLITLGGCYDKKLGRTLNAGDIIEEEVLEVTEKGLKIHIYSSSLFDTTVVLLDDTQEPGKPSEPSHDNDDDDDDDEDDNLQETADEKTSNPAKTGDHMGSFMWMWSIVLIAAAAGIVSTLAVRFRRKK